MKTLFAAAALSLMAGAAIAAEGNGNPFPFTVPTSPVALNGYRAAAGVSQNPFPFTMPATPMVADQVLPPNGSAGVVQTANSLPRGFEDGVPGQANLNHHAAPAPTRLAQPDATAQNPRG